MGVTPTMKTLYKTHVQIMDRRWGDEINEVRSVESVLNELAHIGAYEPGINYTFRFRNANNTITVVFNADIDLEWGVIMRGKQFFDSVIDAVQFKKMLANYFDRNSGDHYTFYIPASLPHVCDRYRR